MKSISSKWSGSCSPLRTHSALDGIKIKQNKTKKHWCSLSALIRKQIQNRLQAHDRGNKKNSSSGAATPLRITHLFTDFSLLLIFILNFLYSNLIILLGMLPTLGALGCHDQCLNTKVRSFRSFSRRNVEISVDDVKFIQGCSEDIFLHYRVHLF